MVCRRRFICRLIRCWVSPLNWNDQFCLHRMVSDIFLSTCNFHLLCETEKTLTISYKSGIIKAINYLKDCTGLSMIAIIKVMPDDIPKENKCLNATFLSGLKASVDSGNFTQIKNLYKLSPELKKIRIYTEKKAAAPNKNDAPMKISVPKK